MKDIIKQLIPWLFIVIILAMAWYRPRKKSKQLDPRDPRMCACGHPYSVKNGDGSCAGEVKRSEFDHFDDEWDNEVFRTVWKPCKCVEHISPEQIMHQEIRNWKLPEIEK